MGKKIRAKLAPLTEKKTPPSLALLHHLFDASWHEALGTPFLISSSLYFRCKGCNHFIFNINLLS